MVNRIRQTLMTCAAIVAGTGAAWAQTITQGPVTTTHKIAWDIPANLTLINAPTFEARVSIDGTPALTLTSVIWAAATATAPAGGSAVLSASQVDALNRIGSHAITVSLFRADVGDSGPSLPFVLRSPAGVPTGARVTR